MDSRRSPCCLKLAPPWQAAAATNARDRREWEFLGVMFTDNPRTSLLKLLGYDAESVASEGASFEAAAFGAEGDAAGAATADGAGETKADNEDDNDDPFGAPPGEAASSAGAGAGAGAGSEVAVSADEVSETQQQSGLCIFLC